MIVSRHTIWVLSYVSGTIVTNIATSDVELQHVFSFLILATVLGTHHVSSIIMELLGLLIKFVSARFLLIFLQSL